jgi:HD superfamily phosphohydrolase
MGERERILDYLETKFTEPIRDPVWKHIYLTPAHEKIISLPQFQELHAIKQLGPAYLVYPGATHTRFAHSLGTFHIAGRLISSLVRTSGRTPFTLSGVKAYLCAALCHDLGHYPFAHALKNLGLTDHEVLTGRLLRENSLARVIALDVGAEAQRAAAVVDETISAAGDPEIPLLRKLLSGVLDPDKLDYLNRDAYYCGVPYGVQDVDFFLGEVFADRDRGFLLSASGLTAVENILFAKYLMYKTVYWHKTVRTATAMIRKSLLLALRDGELEPERLYRLTDSGLLALATGRAYPPFALIPEVFSRRLYKRLFSTVFRDDHPGHRLLCAPGPCLKREADLARELGAITGRRVAEEDIIIDIPEALTFEIDLPVADGNGGVTAEETTVWRGRSADFFGRTLRTVSLLVRRDTGLVAAAQRYCRESDPFRA